MESQCSVSHSLTSPDVYLRISTSSHAKHTWFKHFSLYKNATAEWMPILHDRLRSWSLREYLTSPSHCWIISPLTLSSLYSLWLVVILFSEIFVASWSFENYRGVVWAEQCWIFHPLMWTSCREDLQQELKVISAVHSSEDVLRASMQFENFECRTPFTCFFSSSCKMLHVYISAYN